jgi:short-subunit dehydrogenase
MKGDGMAKLLLMIGVGPGIGLATAERFAREGFDLVLASRNPERFEPEIARIRATGVQVTPKTVDAADPAAVDRLVQAYADDIEVLHYNAAALRYAGDHLALELIDELAVAQIDTDITVNITSALAAVHAALPAMRRRKAGAILLTGGGLALHPFAQLLTLSVGKAGIRTLAQALFEPAKADGVHVATVTVAASVAPNSTTAAAIAERFWSLYASAPADWAWDDLYTA